METQLDARYLRPGALSWSGAIGLGAVGVGLGVLLACWGLSLFWHRDDLALHLIPGLETRITEGLDALGQRIARLEQRPVQVVPAPAPTPAPAPRETSTLRRDDCVLIDPQGRHIDCTGTHELVEQPGNIIKREVTAFFYVKHGDGAVATGWTYKDGGSDGVPQSQYCYYTVANAQGGSIKIDIGSDGGRLSNADMSTVPSLEEALGKCHWHTNG